MLNSLMAIWMLTANRTTLSPPPRAENFPKSRGPILFNFFMLTPIGLKASDVTHSMLWCKAG